MLDGDFFKVFELIKKQPLNRFPNIESIDYDFVIIAKDKVIVEYKALIKSKAKIKPEYEIERIAEFVIANSEHYLNIWNVGYFLNMSLLCRLWAFADLIKEINLEKETNKNNHTHHKTLFTYLWQSNQDKELPELFKLMVNKYELIAPETTIEQFTAIFTEKPVDSITPLKWLNSNRLLAYFLDCAFSGQDWQSITGNGKLFVNSKGTFLKANDLSVAKNGFKHGYPKGYEKIDRILKEIKNIQNIKTS